MKLIKAIIRNFRSIGNLDILFKGNGHKILAGINESGKSNILKALHLLAGGMFTSADKKVVFGEQDTRAYVAFEYDLSEELHKTCYEHFLGRFYTVDHTANMVSGHTIESFYKKYARVYYWFDVDTPPRWHYDPVSEDVQISDEWYYLGEGHQIEGVVPDSYIHDTYLRSNLHQDIRNQLEPLLVPATVDGIRATLHRIIENHVYLSPTPCTYWKYDSTTCDLPTEINIDRFSQNPDICMPLQQMFMLAGYQGKSITDKILEARGVRLSNLSSLLQHVTQKTQEHIRKNWQMYSKEYSDVKIELQVNGPNFYISVNDASNKFDFAERSDGFRRFVSILLLMSSTKNSLILMDEPETGLHPSSAKSLRNFLIELGNNNMVVYATHSISMIDNANLSNNLTVYKDNEDTTFKRPKTIKRPKTTHGALPTETIYQAMGYSVYEQLKKKNILLEGYTDKNIIRLFMQGKEWKEIGVCYTNGVGNIRHVIPNIELVDREFCVLSDADNNAKQEQQRLNIENWWTYRDLGIEATTIEDFYNRRFFDDITKSALEQVEKGADKIPRNVIDDGSRLSSIRGFLHKKGTDKEVINKIIDDIKGRCAENIQVENMDESKMKSMLSALLKKINS